MKKILLLTTLFLSSANVYAACNPNLPACQCAYPEMKNGIIGCSASYCGAEKCMPDGSCCESEKYCESTDKGKECCSDGQTCDSTKGCIESKNLEDLCQKANGSIMERNGRKFCRAPDYMNWNDGKSWCETNGMAMPTLDEMCPTWNGTFGQHHACPEMDTLQEFCAGEYWTATLGGKGAYWVAVCGAVNSDPIEYAICSTICW